MEINCISPYIRVAWDNTLNSNDFILPRVNFDFEIIYFKNGSGTITIETTSYKILPGDIFFLKPAVKHAIYPDSNSFLHQPHIHFDIFYENNSPDINISFRLPEKMTDVEQTYFRENMFANPPYDVPEKITVSNISYFENLLFDVIEEYEMKHLFYEINLKAKFLRLLSYILIEHEKTKKLYPISQKRELEHIKDYIKANINKAISLNDLEKEFNISKYYLTRVFKNKYSISPIHYHQAMRIEKIKETILYTNISLTDISDMFGYENISVFSRAFRSYEGYPPSLLRKSN